MHPHQILKILRSEKPHETLPIKNIRTSHQITKGSWRRMKVYGNEGRLSSSPEVGGCKNSEATTCLCSPEQATRWIALLSWHWGLCTLTVLHPQPLTVCPLGPVFYHLGGMQGSRCRCEDCKPLQVGYQFPVSPST